MGERERVFWIGVRKAMIEFIRAIEIRYGLESAIVTNAQRKALQRHMKDSKVIDIEQQS